MNKLSRLFLLSLIVLISCNIAWASNKKGVGLADHHAADRIAALNVSWYYTWSSLPIEGVPAEKFVPMLRSRGGRVLNEQIKFFQSHGKVPTLLVFNEPNKAKGDNMSVEEAVRNWPKISSLADHVSSPAAAGVLGPWSDKFYRMAKARNLKVDFMAVHLYGPPDAKKFLKKIDAVHNKYHMPIWITEFAVADWDANDKPGSNRYSDDEVLAFMKAVLPELEKRSYIVRYAWFGAGSHWLTHEQLRTSRLFEKDGSLTALGKYYANFQ